MYLRFFQSLPGSDHVGDDSEHFTWTSLFPRRIQPVTTVIAKAIFSLLIVLRLCKNAKDVELNAFETMQSSLPESRDAERKRQKALRVLNERLNIAASSHGKQVHADIGPASPLSPAEKRVPEMDDLINVSVVNNTTENALSNQ